MSTVMVKLYGHYIDIDSIEAVVSKESSSIVVLSSGYTIKIPELPDSLRDSIENKVRAGNVWNTVFLADAWDEGYVTGVRHEAGLEPPGKFAINPYLND